MAENRPVGCCHGNEEAEKWAIRSCRGKGKVEDQFVSSDWSVGSYRGKEKVENRPVRSCHGKGNVVAWNW